MHVVIVDGPQEIGRIAGARIAEVIRADPRAVLGIATGSSPLGAYAELARLTRAGELDPRGVTAFALDEYVGLPAEHPQSYRTAIRTAVTEPLGLDPARVHVPDGTADDLAAACAEFERRIVEAGGIEMQLLGIGGNGHVGFNEPGSSLASRTRVKTLSQRTRRDNSRFFDSLGDVPLHSVTQGIGTILDARRLLLVAQGEAKSEAVAQLVEGAISSRWPATALQLHPHVTVLVDRAAARRLELIEDYEHVIQHARA